MHLSSSIDGRSVRSLEDFFPRSSKNEESYESKVDSIRESVLGMIRRHMPITTLFNPKLRINLGVFIKDQMFMYRIAQFLAPLTQLECIDSKVVAKHFENSELLIEIKNLLKQDTDSCLPLFYQACSDVLNNQSCSNDLQSAIEGRIFTLKNALIAQHTPAVILNSQKLCHLVLQSLANIKKGGANFIRTNLHLYFYDFKEEATPFKKALNSTAKQLLPFVREITRMYLIENKRACPEDPLTFRNPTGYNHHGLVAATIMETCLNVLGYNTCLLERDDLEPKVTLATCHSIVEVTAPDHTKYIVDPSYIQFHKDVCWDDQLLPTFPVLVLKASKVKWYVEKEIMTQWEMNARYIEEENSTVIQEMLRRDQMLSFKIQSVGLYSDIVPSNPKAWVQKAFGRVWDVQSYSPLSSNQGFQNIFFGIKKLHKTYEYIQFMGIGDLRDHLSFKKIEERLQEIMKNEALKGLNSIEALSLISQLPKVKRDNYISLLNVDTRINAIASSLNAYFCAVKREVNPEGKDLRVIYGCSGADCMTPLLATDANEFIFVDLTKVAYEEFQRAWELLRDSSSDSVINLQLQQSDDFFGTRLRYGGAVSHYNEATKHRMTDLPLKLLFDLRDAGVDLNQVVLTPIQEEQGVKIDFPWQYYGSFAPRSRSLVFMTADITKPESYPDFLQNKLAEGVDIFYMKAAFLAPKYYAQFLPHLAKSIREGGWIMTTDKTMMMEEYNPEKCLKQNDLVFLSQTNEEIKTLEKFMRPYFNPLCSIPSLDVHSKNRIARVTGSDLTYWTVLKLRKKIA